MNTGVSLADWLGDLVKLNVRRKAIDRSRSERSAAWGVHLLLTQMDLSQLLYASVDGCEILKAPRHETMVEATTLLGIYRKSNHSWVS